MSNLKFIIGAASVVGTAAIVVLTLTRCKPMSNEPTQFVQAVDTLRATTVDTVGTFDTSVPAQAVE